MRCTQGPSLDSSAERYRREGHQGCSCGNCHCATMSAKHPYREEELSLPSLAENLSSSIHLHAGRSSHHDRADCHQDDRQSKTFWSAPNVDDLSHGQSSKTGDQGCDHTSKGSETMELELAGHIWSQSPTHGALKRIDEVDDPYTSRQCQNVFDYTGVSVWTHRA